MSDKIKPWQNRKPKHHGDFRNKRKHPQRPSQDKAIVLPRSEDQDRYGQWEKHDRNDYLDE